MSAFGRDLIGNVNCGTANPLMQMAGQMQGMGQQLADVRSFGSADKAGPMGLRPQMGPADLMRPAVVQTGGPEAAHFMPGFQPQMNRPNSMPLHVQQQQQAARQQQMAMQHQRLPSQQPQQSMPNGMDLADQFMQMEMQNKQFEAAFQAPQAAMPGGQEIWGQEFQMHHQQQHQQQRMMHQQQQQRSMHHQPQSMSYGSSYGGGADMLRSRMMGMGFAGGMGMSSYGHPQQAYAPPMSASSIPAPTTAKVAEMPSNVTEEEFDGLYSTGVPKHDNLQDAYREATGGQEMGSHFANEQAQVNGPEQSMAGGMNQDMMQKLMNSDNPKWRVGEHTRTTRASHVDHACGG